MGVKYNTEAIKEHFEDLDPTWASCEFFPFCEDVTNKHAATFRN